MKLDLKDLIYNKILDRLQELDWDIIETTKKLEQLYNDEYNLNYQDTTRQEKFKAIRASSRS